MKPHSKHTFFRTRLPAPTDDLNPMIAGFGGVRLEADEIEEFIVTTADHLAAAQPNAAKDPLNILAISGGAAGGAFGAGVLVGMTRAGTRPAFAMVTGVSTGALIAPFAFLGPAWDERLTLAYTGGLAAELLGFKRMAPAFGAGLFRAEALESLIDPFIDEDLISAVAAEHGKGRRLLVTTTDLDRQRTCIWDMGRIASQRSPEALTLFRDILVASASLPGLFPPRRFSCQADGVSYEEMHVDGGVAAPLFIMPEALQRWKRQGGDLRGGRIYVIVNTVLEQAPRTTSPNLAAILIRSFDTMLRFSYRNALNHAATFCAANDLSFSAATILDDGKNGNMLNFDTSAMQRIFDAAVERAGAGDLWVTPAPRGVDAQGAELGAA